MQERGRRVMWWTGVGLLVAGLAMCGYIAWEFYGTTWLSRRHQSEARSEVYQAWADGQHIAHTRWGDVGAMIQIPRFGSGYSVPVFQGTSTSVLAVGFGHFAHTAGPGQVGNYALAGHRITHGEPLRNMPSLEAGDEVDVVTRTTTYVYRLTSGGADLTVPFTAGWVVDPLPKNPTPGGIEPAQHRGQRLITLTTCAELFHTDNRLIAFGVLTGRRPTTASQVASALPRNPSSAGSIRRQ